MRSPIPVLSAVSLTVVAGFALGLGCGTSVFGCLDNLSCLKNGVTGVCQTSGFCAFPDSECASGLRYGEHAPSDLARSCVLEHVDGTTDDGTTVDGTTDDGTTDDATTDDATTDDASGSEPGSTATTVANLEGSEASSDSTTSTEDGSTSTEDGSTSTDDGIAESTGEDASTGGDGAGPPCEAGFWDDFEDDSLAGNWALWTLATYDEPLESEGRVRMSLPITDNGWVGIVSDIGPMQGRSAGVEWTFDAFDPLGFAWFNVQSGTKFEFAVSDDMLEVRIGQGADTTGIAWLEFDPIEHRFVRIRATDSLMVWETSSDGSRWTEVYSVAHVGVGESHTLEFGIGTWTQLESGAAMDVHQAFRCP